MANELDLPTPEELELPTPEELDLPIPEESIMGPPEPSDEQRRQRAQEQFRQANLKTGKLSAAVQHAAPSLSLGVSDVIAGGAGAAGHALGALTEYGELPSKKELLETYYEAKKRTGKRREKAMEDQPAASVTGMVGGAFLTPIPGAGLAKLGKVGKTISKVLPSMKGADKISKAGKLAEKARLVGDMGRYKTLKTMQQAAALKLAAREGVKAGAISGGTMGESKLLEGDTDGFIDDVVYGGVAGAGLGVGFTKGLQVSGAILKKIPGIQNAIDSFRYGSKGIDLNEAEVNHEINKAATKYIKEFDSRLSKLGINKQKSLEQLDELGITINGKSEIEQAKKIVSGIDSPTERKEAQKFLDILDDYLDEGKEYKKIHNQLQKKITKARYSDPVGEARIKQQRSDLKEAIEKHKVPVESEDLGIVSSKDVLPEGPEVSAVVKKDVLEIPTKQGVTRVDQVKSQPLNEFKPSSIQRAVDPETGREVAMFQDAGKGKIHAIVGEETSILNAEKLTTTQANKLKNLMNRYSKLSKKGEYPDEVKEAATKAATMINDKINGAGDKIGSDISELNRKMSNIMTAKERIGLSENNVTAIDKEDSLKAMAKFVAGIGDNNPVSDKNLVIQRLRKSDPKLAEQLSAELDDLRRQYELMKPSEAMTPSNSVRALMGTVNGVWNKAWNTLGQTMSAPFRAVEKGRQATQRYLANKTLEFVEASPAQMQGLINKIKESGNRAYGIYAAPIQRALQSKTRTKQAILYGLYQQPAFREMVDSLHTEEPTEE